MELLILAGIIWACRHAVKDTTAAVRKYRDRRMAEILKARPEVAGDPKKAARQQMRVETGWWLGEVLRGFPVARTGWHAGWIAHQTAVLHQRKVRDEARDTHAETRESLALAYEQRRQQAQDAIDQYTTTWSTPPKGKARREAVKEAALAPVVPIRPDQPEQLAAPPRGPFATRRDSAWLEPGDRRCGTCGGTGAIAAGTCPVCRGWGSAPADPGAPEAGPGTICAACGRPGTADDPVLRDGRHLIHRSEAIESTERARAAELALTSLRAAPQTRGDFVTPDGNLMIVRDSSYFKVPDGPSAPATSNGGTAVPTGTTAETTYDQTQVQLRNGINEQEAIIASLRASHLPALVEEVASSGVDAGTLGRLADVHDAHTQQIEAAQRALDLLQGTSDGLQRDHGGLNEAHQSAPVEAANKEFYQG